MLIAFDSTQQRVQKCRWSTRISKLIFSYTKRDYGWLCIIDSIPPDALNDVQAIIRQERVEIRGIFALDNNEKYINIEE